MPHKSIAKVEVFQSPAVPLTPGDSNVYPIQQEIRKNYRYNFVVNVIDGGFFGAALGFASFVTVIPLFVSSLTQSAVLIGLIPAIHAVGWQLPQLLTADRVSRLKRFKPLVLFLSVHERIPFFGLALLAWFLPGMSPNLVLVLTFALLVWQGLGGGLTATAWQSMIGKIMPAGRIGTFYGAQSAIANMLASGAAVIAGLLLERFGSPLDFTACFLLAGIAMTISWLFLARTREPAVQPDGPPRSTRDFWLNLRTILRRDTNFRWFLFARMLSQLGTMAFAFYTVYAVRVYGMSEGLAGVMTGVLMAIQIAANPLMGAIGDRYGHRLILELGILAAVASALIAWLAPSVLWFYLVFALAGIANVAAWTTPMAMILEFGESGERPAYIGLANTVVAPVTFLAPLLGGWLADFSGYRATFLLSASIGLLTAIVVHLAVRDPRQRATARR